MLYRNKVVISCVFLFLRRVVSADVGAVRCNVLSREEGGMIYAIKICPSRISITKNQRMLV